MWEFGGQPLPGNLSTDQLRIDEAYLNLSSTASSRLYVYSLIDECVKCPWTRWREMAPGRSAIARIGTKYGVSWRLFQQDVGSLAYDIQTSFATIDHPKVGQFGLYKLDCDNDKCVFTEIQEAVNFNISILYFLLIVLLLSTAIYLTNWTIGQYVKRTSVARYTDEQPAVPSSPEASVDTELDATVTMAAAKRGRLRSLDAFRGLTIVVMVFVNYGGGQYWWMVHSTWNGLYVADVLFPCFLWIMGVCLPIALQSQLANSVPKRIMIGRVVKRSIKLFLLGFMLNTINGPQLENVRIMNVLQRFGIAYFIVATMYILMAVPLSCPEASGRCRRALQDMIVLLPQWLVAIAMVVLHLTIVYALQVPGCERGYVGPGGNHDWGTHRNCTGGVPGYIDRAVFGEKHLYGGGRSTKIYDTQQPFDPEGLFGCVLTCVHVFLGVQCGVTLLVYSEWKARVKRWLIWAAAFALSAGILCGFQIDDGPIPINKHMWSLSFVLVTSAIALAVFTLMYWLIDVQRWWSGEPFRWPGMNSILIYFGHEVISGMWPFHWRIGLMNTHFMQLLENGWSAAVWIGVAWYLHRKKWYLKV